MTDDDRAGLPEPFRENLVRAMPDMSFRPADKAADGRLGTLYGRLATYNSWYEVNSPVEGHYMEVVLPGAFTKTFAENRSNMRVLFDHGQDREVGRRPLGPLDTITDSASGLDYESALLPGVPELIVSGLRANQYGSSYRMEIPRSKDVWNYRPGPSAHNPLGLPEHTVREAKIKEFGPTPFPLGLGTSAGVRSMTDRYLRGLLMEDTETTPNEPATEPDAPATALPGPEATQSDEGSRVEPPDPPPDAAPPPDVPATTQDPPDGGSSDSQEIPVADETRSDSTALTPDQWPGRLDELYSRSDTFTTQHRGVLSKELQGEFDGMAAEIVKLEADIKADALRRAFVADRAASPANVESEQSVSYQPTAFNTPKQRVRDIYSFTDIRSASNGWEDERQLLRDSAMRAIEDGRFAHMDRAVGQGRVEDLLKTTGSLEDDRTDYVAHRILLTGNPTYRRALHKTLLGSTLNAQETEAYSRFQEYERAMGQVTGSAGGFGVTFDLDPTMIQTSTGAVVPYRRASRVVTTTTNEWRGVTSGGVVAAYAAEAAVGTDNSPTLAQPAALVQKAHCFVPFSMEIQGDYVGLEAELGREISDAKDVLEAVQFTTGAGTTVFPQGIVTGSTVASTLATTGVLAAADLYNTEMTLAPRFRQRAHWFANRMFYNKIRAIDTAGGAQLWTQNLTIGLTNDFQGNTGYRLLGYPANEASGFTTTFAGAGNKVAVFGDPNYFVIVDRVGLNLELVPILTQQATAGTGFGIPTGQRGVYAWWRNTSKVLSAAAFLTVTTA